MSKFDDTFPETTEFSTFQLDVTDDNAQSITFDDLTVDQARQIIDLAEELTAEPEEKADEAATE